MIDLRQDLDPIGAIIGGGLSASAEVARQVGEVAGPLSTGTPDAFSRIGPRSPRQWPGRMTRSMPAETSRCRATHRGVIRAATVIGMTATSGSKPAREPVDRGPGGGRTRPAGR